MLPENIDDGKAEGISISQKQIDDRKAEIYKPLETYTVGRNEIEVSFYHHDSSNQASESPHGTKYAEPHTQKCDDGA
jgi:hypothetical protein